MLPKRLSSHKTIVFSFGNSYIQSSPYSLLMAHQKLIESCLACIQAGSACINCCLGEGPSREQCVRNCMDCTDACTALVRILGRGGGLENELKTLCRNACTACAAECSQHDDPHCQNCAEKCRSCLAVLN